ncbi:MAG: glycosyltransferase [Puniceicoccales bacterium]|nr:glycosyltransferase [Puniceicoccales bacterium]
MVRIWQRAFWMLAVLFPVMCFAENTKNLPEVSVVIPIYNGKTYLARSLNSVLNQSFKNLEIICVDDGSTDGSLEILKQYAAQDPRVVVLENGINRGTLYARLRGILHSTGKYIMTLDCDDEFLPGIIAKAHEIAIERHADVVHFSSKSVDTSGGVRNTIKKSRPIFGAIDSGEQSAIDVFVQSRAIFYIWDKMFARKPLIAAARHLFPWAAQKHIVYAEDFLIQFFAMKNINRYIGTKFPGYRHYASIGVVGMAQRDAHKLITAHEDCHRVFLKTIFDFDKVGDAAHALQLMQYHQFPVYEYIATLPFGDSIDLFAQYVDRVPLKLRLKAASDMRRTSPCWCRDVRRLAKVCRRNRRTDKISGRFAASTDKIFTCG